MVSWGTIKSGYDRLPYASLSSPGGGGNRVWWLVNLQQLKSSSPGRAWHYRHLLTGALSAILRSHFQLPPPLPFHLILSIYFPPSAISFGLVGFVSLFRFLITLHFPLCPCCRASPNPVQRQSLIRTQVSTLLYAPYPASPQDERRTRSHPRQEEGEPPVRDGTSGINFSIVPRS